MDKTAIFILEDYIRKNINPDINSGDYYIVWKCYILRNAKYLIGWKGVNGYFELTYNNNRDEWYLDRYQLKDKRIIKNVD